MKILISMLTMLISYSALADFNTDTEPFHPADGTSIYGMKIVKSLPSKNGLARLGVKKGDIVLSWNHRQIADDVTALQAYNETKVTSAHVIRDGHSKFLKDMK